MILSFHDAKTKRFFENAGARVPWQGAASVAKRKLDMLNAAKEADDLRAPPGNRLELLDGERVGQWSIRINDKWRVCFRWPDGAPGPSDVEIVDYHR
jgi:proteic killer suppression protein